jgi:hypothetical protein
LLRVLHKDASAVGRAEVAELAVLLCGIDGAPEVFEQLLVAHHLGVEHHFHRFGMAGFLGGHIVVAGVGCFSANVARGGGLDACHLVEIGLHAPEAAASERGFGQTRRRGAGGGGLRVGSQRGEQQGGGNQLHAASGTNFSATPLLQ